MAAFISSYYLLNACGNIEWEPELARRLSMWSVHVLFRVYYSTPASFYRSKSCSYVRLELGKVIHSNCL